MLSIRSSKLLVWLVLVNSSAHADVTNCLLDFTNFVSPVSLALSEAGSTRRIVNGVVNGIPKGQKIELALGDQFIDGPRTYVVIERGLQKTEAQNKLMANPTGLSSAIAIIEDGKPKIHFERGARVDSVDDRVANQAKLEKDTGVTPDAIAEKVKGFVTERYAGGALDLPGHARIQAEEVPNFYILKTSQLDRNTWVVRARTSVRLNLFGVSPRPEDNGRMYVRVTAIVGRDGSITVLADHNRQKLQKQILEMAHLPQGTAPVTDYEGLLNDRTFRIAAVHDRSDGMSGDAFGDYEPARYRVTTSRLVEVKTKLKRRRGHKITYETHFEDGSYDSRWGLVLPGEKPKKRFPRKPKPAPESNSAPELELVSESEPEPPPTEPHLEEATSD